MHFIKKCPEFGPPVSKVSMGHEMVLVNHQFSLPISSALAASDSRKKCFSLSKHVSTLSSSRHALLMFLLLLSGTVESNPGPT